MPSPTSVSELTSASNDELESVFAHEQEVPMPVDGIWQGTFLRRLDTLGARSWRAWFLPAFEHLPFGLKFAPGEGEWFFFDEKLAAGSFTPRLELSRWRDTTVVTCNYEVSLLPFRGALYDEVKPLSENLFLGMGGLNAGRDEGDLFFFSGERIG